MTKNRLSHFLILGLFFVSTSALYAQTDTTKRSQRRSYDGNVKLNTWSATIRGGLTQFYGDLRQGDFKRGDAAKKGTFAVGASINKQLSHIFGVSANFDAGNLSGSKAVDYNAYFNAHFFQGSLTFDVNLKSLIIGPHKLRRWKVDAYGGLGMMWFNSDVYAIADNPNQGFLIPGDPLGRRSGVMKDQLLGSSNIPATSPRTSGSWLDYGSDFTRDIVVPVGLNVTYELSKRLDLGLGYNYNFLNSSKLDMTKPGEVNDHSAGIFIFGDKGDGRHDRWGQLSLQLTYKIGRNPARATKDGKHPPEAGTYHLRWTAPDDLIPPVYNPTMDTAIARVKAIMPKAVDPRLYTDTDGDSVADLFDKEPNTPPNSVVSGGGVAMDLNKLIKDILDKKKPNDTCLELFGNVEFRTDQAVIPTASYQNLQTLVQYLNTSPDCRVILVGHTDRRESDAYNMKLSQRRATAVKKYLIQSGLKDASRVLIEYYGELKPTAANTTQDGMRANRRVEIKVRANNQWRDYPGN